MDDEVNELVPVEDQPSPSGMLSNTTYDRLKRFITLVLPAFGTFYVTVAALTELPWGDQVAGICLALGTFLGIVLNASGRAYDKSDAKYDGVVRLEPGDNGAPKAILTPEVQDAFINQDEVRLKIQGP